MSIKHGLYIQEEATSLTAPVAVDSAVIVAIGTAPVNLVDNDDPTQPQLAYNLNEARTKVGYSGDMGLTLNQVTLAAFELFGVAPVVYLNLLDPKKHIAKGSAEVTMANGKAVLPVQGVVLPSFKVTSETDETLVEYEAGVDYLATFDADGSVLVSAVDGGALQGGNFELKVSYDRLDPDAVTEEQVGAAIERIGEVFPRFGLLPGVIIAPGWSHIPAVYNKLVAKAEGLHGAFGSFVVADVDVEAAPTYDKVGAWKNEKGMTHSRSALLWPKVNVGGVPIYYSAVYAALIAHTDNANGGVPYVSPSNKSLPIEGICDHEGRAIILDMEQANLLNGQGVNAAINMMGWCSWGNYTACYPTSTDAKDAFIAVRRMFTWWGNTFVRTYFQRVDDPMNLRLIEAIVDSENIRANGFKARYQIADAYMELVAEDNPATELMQGNLTVRQVLTPYPPAQSITNVLSFDPEGLTAALGLT